MIRRDQRRPQERLEPRAAVRRWTTKERRTNGALPRLRTHANLQLPVVRVDDVRGVQRRLDAFLRAADRSQQHALTVERDLELVLVLQPSNRAKVGLQQPDLDHVFAVERECVRGHEAAARAGREVLVLLHLRRVAADPIRFRSGHDTRAADRQLADVRRGGKITFQQAGDTPRRLALLSKPSAESSGGSSVAVSTSSASRSRIAFAYSL